MHCLKCKSDSEVLAADPFQQCDRMEIWARIAFRYSADLSSDVLDPSLRQKRKV